MKLQLHNVLCDNYRLQATAGGSTPTSKVGPSCRPRDNGHPTFQRTLTNVITAVNERNNDGVFRLLTAKVLYYSL